MKQPEKNQDRFESSGTSPPQAQPADAKDRNVFTQPVQLTREQEKQLRDEKKKNRTIGLKLFDVLLYPIITNFAVFFMSVGATYMTRHGNELNAAGNPKFGALGAFFQKRGNAVKSIFRNMGANEHAAANANMVFWSFFDGTLISPLVKIFEDRREKIGNWIDDRLGTTAEDRSVYEAEPKQTWGSVVSGRLLASMLVVPTAVVLEKTRWNDKLFHDPGLKTGEKIQQTMPRLTSWLGRFEPKKLFPIVYFEAFYTSLCTAGLYFISRTIAKPKPKTLPQTVSETAAVRARPLEPEQPPEIKESQLPVTPHTTITEAAASQRINSSQPLAPNLA